MKKLLISFIFTISLIAAKSQLTKGNWLVGGSGSFYTYHEDFKSPPGQHLTAKNTSIDISGSVGYFSIEKSVAGLRATVSSVASESSGGGSMNNVKFALGPFVRYYFLEAQKPFNLLADVCYQIGVNKNYVGTMDGGKFNIFSMAGGVEVFFNSSVGMEILVGYSNKLITIHDAATALRNNKKGLQASIGFQFHLEKE